MAKPTDFELLMQSEDPVVSALARDIMSQSQQLEGAGIDPGPLEPRKSLLMTGLDWLDTPRQAVTGIIDSAVRGDLGEQGIFGAASRGMSEDISTADILRRADVNNPFIRGVAGFAGDVLSDPLSYLTLGTSGLAKAGGTALSKSGQSRAAQYVARSLQGADEVGDYASRMLAANMRLDEAGSALRRLDEGQQFAKLFQRTAKSKEGVVDVTAYLNTLNDNVEHAKLVEEVFGSGAASQVDDLIGRGQRVALEANLPFLGFMDKADTPALKALQKEGGPVGEVFDGVIKGGGAGKAVAESLGAVGKAINPGKVGFLEKQLSQEELVRLQQFALESKQRMGEFAMKADQILRKVPGGALASDAGKKIVDLSTSAAAAVGKQFKRIFVAGYLGPDFEKARSEFINTKAVAENVAVGDVMSKFSDLVGNPQGEDLLKRAYYVIDGAAKEEIAALSRLSPDMAESILTKINAHRLGIDDAGETFADLYKKAAAIDPSFGSGTLSANQRVNQALDAIGAEPELRQVVQRVQDYMDGLVVNEIRDGIELSPLDAYVPHVYTNKRVLDPVTKKAVTTGPINGGFTKSRKYSTVDEALTTSGLVQDSNVANLLAERARKSWIKRAEANFAKRSFIQGGMTTEQLQVLANSALKGDEAAAHLLSGRGFDLPEARTLDDASAKNLLNLLKGPFKEFEPKRLMELGMSEGDAVRAALDLNSGAIKDMADYARSLHANMFAIGARPKDLAVPQSILGEIADKVKIPTTGEEVWLPKELGRAVRETLHGRDFVKNYAGRSEIGQRLLNTSDSAVAFFKRMATLPWPAYWSQNLIGDNLFKLMDGGITAMNPGYIQKAHALLAGKSAIKTPYGVITPDVLLRALKENGINFGSRDMLGLIDNFDAMDVSRAIAGKGGLMASVKNAMKSGRSATEAAYEGLKAAQEGMQFAFGDMMRVSHIIHRLERGDTISEAIRLGQDAMLNYRTLSPVEQSLFRRFFMFYGFLGQGTKRMLGSLMQRPGDFAMQIKAARGAAEMFSQPDAAPTADEVDLNLFKSAAAAEQVAFALGKDRSGKPIIGRGFGLPVNTVLGAVDIQLPRSMKLGEVIDAVGDSTMRTIQKSFAASVTPIQKAAELISGKNLYFNKPISSAFLRKWPSYERASQVLREYPGGAIPAAALEGLDKVTRKVLGGVPDGKGNFIVPTKTHWLLTSFVPGFSRMLSTATALNNVEMPTGVRAARALTGIRTEPYNPEMGALSSIRDNLQQLATDSSLAQRRRNADAGIE